MILILKLLRNNWRAENENVVTAESRFENENIVSASFFIGNLQKPKKFEIKYPITEAKVCLFYFNWE